MVNDINIKTSNLFDHITIIRSEMFELMLAIKESDFELFFQKLDKINELNAIIQKQIKILNNKSNALKESKII